MALIPITPPPGLYANGTLHQAKGRWRSGNLIRFERDQIRPVGGWRKRSDAAPVGRAARAVLAWRDNSNSRWIAIGTSTKLFVQDEAGRNHDVTPADFAGGREDAEQNLGYGGGTFGTNAYGAPPPNTVAYLPASVWSLDSWGEQLVGCCDTDGRIYLWTLIPSAPAAAVAGAPAGCAGLVVTQDGFLFALGAGGDGRRVAWCDQRDISVWTAAAVNQAGDYNLPTLGTLQSGKAVPGGALLFTDVDVWRAAYIGAPLVYGFERVGSGCAPISKGAVAARDSLAVWMGKGAAFWLFNGQSVEPLDCEVQDYLADMNLDQASKVTAVHLAEQGECWWFFPSGSSRECDRYVAWGYRESERLGRNVWCFGELARTAGTGRSVFANPLMVDEAGHLYEHEAGLNHGGAQPFVESGPMALGDGDFMMEVQRVVPDSGGDGLVQAALFTRAWPNGPEAEAGRVLLDSPTDVLLQAAEVRVRFTGVSPAWRVGAMRLDVVRGDPADSALALGTPPLEDQSGLPLLDQFDHYLGA